MRDNFWKYFWTGLFLSWRPPPQLFHGQVGTKVKCSKSFITPKHGFKWEKTQLLGKKNKFWRTKYWGGGPYRRQRQKSNFEKNIWKAQMGPLLNKICKIYDFYIVLRFFFHLKPLLSELSDFSNRSTFLIFFKII